MLDKRCCTTRGLMPDWMASTPSTTSSICWHSTSERRLSRFAIGSHRTRRKNELVKSPLDEIPGIGPTRKRALLRHFGTAKAVSRAALADLEKVPGVNKATARQIYDHFHAG